MNKPRVILWGASPTGQGLVVLDAMLASNAFEVVGFVDDNATSHGALLYGYKVLGGREVLSTVDRDTLVFPAVGNNRLRLEMLSHCIDSGLRMAIAVHPAAYVGLGATIDDGSFVAAGAVVAAGAKINRCCIVNTLASVDHNVVMSDGANVSPGSHLAGRVRVGEGAFIGTGASVIPDIKIGAWSVVGAGSVVIRDVPAEATVVGAPAVEKQ